MRKSLNNPQKLIQHNVLIKLCKPEEKTVNQKSLLKHKLKINVNADISNKFLN